MFAINDFVKWSRASKSMSGKVVAVIPAGKKISEVVPPETIATYNIKLLGNPKGLPARKEESYLVETLVGDRGIKCLVWPAADALEAED